MKAQHYKVIGTGKLTTPELYAGQFVSRSDKDSTVRGFVSEVFDYSFNVMLFELDELPELPIYVILNEELPITDIVDKLAEILANDTSIIPMWESNYNNIGKNDELDH